MYKDGKKVETLRTDRTGKVISQKLKPGKYTLKETKAPQGYKLLKEEIEVVVEANKVISTSRKCKRTRKLTSNQKGCRDWKSSIRRRI